MKLLDLRERRASVVDEMRGLLSSDDLNDDGKARFEALKAENATLEADIARHEVFAEAERRMAADPRDVTRDDRFDVECRSFSLRKAIASQVPGLPVDAGREVEVSQELQRRSGRQHEGITAPMSIFETRTMTGSTGTAGGFLIGTDHRADQYVDLLRSRLVIRRLGARVLSGLIGDVTIPKKGSAATAYWVGDNSAVTTSDLGFEAIALTPKHVGCRTEFSRNLLMQASPDVEQLLRADFGATLAEAIDRAAINGTGAGMPLGILGHEIGSVSLATVTWAAALEFVSDVETANSSGTAFLTHPLVVATLRSTLKETGDAGAGYVMEGPASLAGYPCIASTLVPTNLGAGSDKKALIFGDWSELLLAYWSELDILVNPYETTAYSKGSVQVRGMATVDTAVRHPEAFSAAVDIA